MTKLLQHMQSRDAKNLNLDKNVGDPNHKKQNRLECSNQDKKGSQDEDEDQ